MTPVSRLYVPNSPARPGQAPDFSYVRLSPAGAVPRPAVGAALSELSDLQVTSDGLQIGALNADDLVGRISLPGLDGAPAAGGCVT